MIWLVAVYAQHSDALNTYFNSNVVLAQDDDYTGLTVFKVLQRRVAGVIHVGAGRDGYLGQDRGDARFRRSSACWASCRGSRSGSRR